MKIIQLTRGYSAIVSDRDYTKVNNVNWFPVFSKCKTRVYAYTNTRTEKGYRTISMQNYIMGRKDGLMLDHKDRDGLNNCRSNLRYITRSQNGINARKKINNKSGYSGVLFIARRNKYEAAIKVNRKNIRLGYYATFEEAKSERIKAEEKYFPGINLVRDAVIMKYSMKDEKKINRKWATSKSKFKGVSPLITKYKNIEHKYWVARHFHNGKKIHLGTFKTEIEAARAYIQKVKETHGYEPYKID